jgi:hypothetical protein
MPDVAPGPSPLAIRQTQHQLFSPQSRADARQSKHRAYGEHSKSRSQLTGPVSSKGNCNHQATQAGEDPIPVRAALKNNFAIVRANEFQWDIHSQFRESFP